MLDVSGHACGSCRGNRSTEYHAAVRHLPLLLTLTKWRAPINASKWRIGFNSAFKGLNSVKMPPKNMENFSTPLEIMLCPENKLSAGTKCFLEAETLLKTSRAADDHQTTRTYDNTARVKELVRSDRI
jgi:hypothetical protein